MIAMGNLLFESGHAQNAAKYFQQALVYNPDELQALIGLANAKYDMGAPMQAIEYYERVLEIEPDNAWARDERRRYARYLTYD